MEDSQTKSWAALVAPESHRSAHSAEKSCNTSPLRVEHGSLKDNRPQPSAVNDAPSRAGNKAKRQSQRRRKTKKNDKIHENGCSGAKGTLQQQTKKKEKEQKKKQPAIFSAPPANAWNKAEETKAIIGTTYEFSGTMKEDVCESVRNMGLVSEEETPKDHSIVSDDDADNNNHEDPSEQSENALLSLSKSFEDIQYSAQYRVVPKGIDNPGNICFASSVIQALLACPSFCQIFYTLRRAAPSIKSKEYPVLKSMSVLAREFRFEAVQDEQVDDLKDGHTSWSDSINVGVVTSLIHESFRIRYKGADKKRQVEQEDAHEFLHSLLDAMHQEMLALQQGLDADGGTVSNGILAQQDSSNDADGWLTKSGKRAVKQQVIRPEVSTHNTLITELFEGMQSTSVSSRGNPPSVTMHPFLIVEIPLFDPNIDSLSGALDSLTATEVLSGYRPRGQDVPCDANKSERFHKLPPVLIFHLMRFQFTGSTEKLNKKIRFEDTLNIKSSWLTSGSKDRQAAYKLVSTISHHGQSIARGHFTAHGLQYGNVWLHFNDEHIYKVREENVLHDSPYLLVYHKI
jgi:ubiquitin C-terminal hydrolase